MSRSIDLLKHRYLKNIKENPELFVGIELEYPVVNLEGDATKPVITQGRDNLCQTCRTTRIHMTWLEKEIDRYC